MRASPLRRVVAVGPCVYRVLYVSYVRRGVTVRDNGIYGLKSSAINTIVLAFIYTLPRITLSITLSELHSVPLHPSQPLHSQKRV